MIDVFIMLCIVYLNVLSSCTMIMLRLYTRLAMAEMRDYVTTSFFLVVQPAWTAGCSNQSRQA